MSTNKDREIEILTHNINQLTTKIANMKKANINENKIKKLEMELERYIQWKNQINEENKL